MLNDLNPKDYKNIYIVCGFTDMRYGINGLSAIIEQKYKMNVFIGKTLFMFCGHNARLMKALLWSEQAIRPFTIGRMNYLFCEYVNGANASAVIYSIIETAKANNLHVHRYLEFLITELSKRRKAGTLNHIDDLLPWAKIPQKECKAPIKNS